VGRGVLRRADLAFRRRRLALGASGALYAGANLEFPGMPLGASVHAEQFAVANAWLAGETAIVHLAVTAMPCGHCRQFLMEAGDPTGLAISAPGHAAATLAELLPHAFRPADLRVEARLLGGARASLGASAGPTPPAADELARAARDAASRSYAPYSGALAGAALRLDDGSVAVGRYAECAAFNPSLLAVQCALVARAADARSAVPVADAVVAEMPAASSQRTAAEALLASLGVPARFVAVVLER